MRCGAVYPDGKVCISILHPPGDDPSGYEHSSERWSPVQSVDKILLSVVSLLAEPNDESPANVDAAVRAWARPWGPKGRWSDDCLLWICCCVEYRRCGVRTGKRFAAARWTACAAAWACPPESIAAFLHSHTDQKNNTTKKNPVWRLLGRLPRALRSRLPSSG